MERRPKVLILADDLSGAADCSVAWTRCGQRPVISLDAAGAGGWAAITAVDINSRNLSAEDARAAAMRALELRGASAAGTIYQKMDSALRGNWAAELSGILGALGRRTGRRPLAIVAPALPSAGRAVLGGRGFLHGGPLAESAIWRDAGMAGPADIPAMLARCGLEGRSLPLAAVRAGAGALETVFRDLAAQHVSSVVCDGESDDDLATIAGGAIRVPGCVWVGSAGLMHALAATGAPCPPAWQPPIAVNGRPILTVVGSRSETSHRQFRVLSQQPRLAALEIPVEDLLSGTVGSRVGQALENALGAGLDAAIAVAAGGRAAAADGPRITAALGAVVAPHLSRIGGLVMTGGETARAIFDAAGVRRLEVLGEIEPGAPLSQTGDPFPILAVTKSGSFGDDRTLIRCRDRLRDGRADDDVQETRASATGGLNG